MVKNGNSVAISDYCRIDNCVISSIDLGNGGYLNVWCTNTMLIFCFHTIEMFFIPWQKAVGVFHFGNDDYTNISVFLLRMAFSAICLYVVPKFKWGRYLFCIK